MKQMLDTLPDHYRMQSFEEAETRRAALEDCLAECDSRAPLSQPPDHDLIRRVYAESFKDLFERKVS